MYPFRFGFPLYPTQHNYLKTQTVAVLMVQLFLWLSSVP